jgi:uncharacterized CHY-type Zn-finger protein
MAEPSEKSKEIEKALNCFSTTAYGRSRTDSIKNNICVFCGGPAEEFEDDLSRKEYTISGMCQVCQDNFFGD